jgi:hypothetical protein
MGRRCSLSLFLIFEAGSARLWMILTLSSGTGCPADNVPEGVRILPGVRLCSAMSSAALRIISIPDRLVRELSAMMLVAEEERKEEEKPKGNGGV